MPRTVPEYMQSLKQATSLNYNRIAVELKLPRQFIYELRDGKCRTSYADGRRIRATEDERYQALDALFTKHGITGFLDAVHRTQFSRPDERPVDNETRIRQALQGLEDVLRDHGRFQNAAIRNAYLALYGALLDENQ